MIWCALLAGGHLWEVPYHGDHPALYRDEDGSILVVVQVDAGPDVRILRHAGGEWVDDCRVPYGLRRVIAGRLSRLGVLSRGAA